MNITNFDSGFAPIPAGRPLGLDALQDGEYTFRIILAELANTSKTGEAIARFTLYVESATDSDSGQGLKVEHVYFLRGQDQANLLGADLLLLGIPTNEWVPGHHSGKKFSTELPDALESLGGILFKAAKTSAPSKTSSKVYHNLRIKGKIGMERMPDPSVPF